MKHLIFFASICFITTCISCNGNRAEATNNKSEPSAQKAPSSSSTGDAVFSYNLDGAKISGGEVVAIMLNNAALVTKSAGNPGRLSFFLSDAYKDNTDIFFHSLKFTILGKMGTILLTADQDKW